MHNQESQEFEIEGGVRQEIILNTQLFNAIMNDIIRKEKRYKRRERGI